MGKKGAIFDIAKLGWVNSMHMREHSSSFLREYAQAEVEPKLRKKLTNWDSGTIERAIGLYKSRVHTVKELCNELVALHDGPQAFDFVREHECFKDDVTELLRAVASGLNSIDSFESEQIGTVIKSVIAAKGVRFVTIAQPLRFALIGKPDGPGLYDTLAILGKPEAIGRIQAVCEAIKK